MENNNNYTHEPKKFEIKNYIIGKMYYGVVPNKVRRDEIGDFSVWKGILVGIKQRRQVTADSSHLDMVAFTLSDDLMITRKSPLIFELEEDAIKARDFLNDEYPSGVLATDLNNIINIELKELNLNFKEVHNRLGDIEFRSEEKGKVISETFRVTNPIKELDIIKGLSVYKLVKDKTDGSRVLYEREVVRLRFEFDENYSSTGTIIIHPLGLMEANDPVRLTGAVVGDKGMNKKVMNYEEVIEEFTPITKALKEIIVDIFSTVNHEKMLNTTITVERDLSLTIKRTYFK